MTAELKNQSNGIIELSMGLPPFPDVSGYNRPMGFSTSTYKTETVTVPRSGKPQWAFKADQDPQA
jgi:hypothetical protein